MQLPRVEILLGTRNGARWLPGQLASIGLQSAVDWSLTVSDDGSTDGTRDVVSAFGSREKSRNISINTGPCAGSAANYLGLIGASDRRAQYTALADQDDVWQPGRIARAIGFLERFDPSIPCVYASRTWEIRQDGSRQRASRRHKHGPCFQNALLQNVLAGNTIVMNQTAMDILRSALIPAQGVPFHDWWIYLLLSGAGAQIVMDDAPTVFYRQHESNLIGSPSSVLAATSRIKGVVSGTYGNWVASNLAAIGQNKCLLTNTSRIQLDRFQTAMARTPVVKGWSLANSGAFRQTRLGNFCVFGAASFGRI